MRVARGAVFVLALGVALAAQARPGVAVPPLSLTWADGKAVELRGDAAPATAVLLFHRSVAAAAAVDGELLQHLRAEHPAQGLELVVVVPTAAPASGEPLPAALAGVHLAIDADDALRQRWLDDTSGNVVVIADERICWVGRPGNGLRARVADALAHRVDFDQNRELWEQRCTLLKNFVDSPGEEARDLAQDIIARRPTDGLCWALSYLAEVQKLGNKAAAELTLGAALEALPRDPLGLAAFADLTLRGDRRNKALARRLEGGLSAAAAAWPGDLRIQLAHLRALVRAGDGRSVGMLAQRLARQVDAHGPSALEFVDILLQDEEPAVHKDLGARTLQSVGGDVDVRQLAALRYALLLRGEGDAAAARELVNDYVSRVPGRACVNNDAWALLTDLGAFGRFDAFALALAERLLEQRASLEPFELDTAAMAMFAGGRFDQAVELQTAAIDRGGDAAVYAERLAAYRAAAAAAAAPR